MGSRPLSPVRTTRCLKLRAKEQRCNPFQQSNKVRQTDEGVLVAIAAKCSGDLLGVGLVSVVGAFGAFAFLGGGAVFV